VAIRRGWTSQRYRGSLRCAGSIDADHYWLVELRAASSADLYEPGQQPGDLGVGQISDDITSVTEAVQGRGPGRRSRLSVGGMAEPGPGELGHLGDLFFVVGVAVVSAENRADMSDQQ